MALVLVISSGAVLQTGRSAAEEILDLETDEEDCWQTEQDGEENASEDTQEETETVSDEGGLQIETIEEGRRVTIRQKPKRRARRRWQAEAESSARADGHRMPLAVKDASMQELCLECPTGNSWRKMRLRFTGRWRSH